MDAVLLSASSKASQGSSLHLPYETARVEVISLSRRDILTASEVSTSAGEEEWSPWY